MRPPRIRPPSARSPCRPRRVAEPPHPKPVLELAAFRPGRLTHRAARRALHLRAVLLAAKRQPHTRARATISLYEHTVRRSTLREQGCSAAKRGVGGIVILDFGQPAANGHSYGTFLFSGRFAGNKAITRAMFAYAVGYSRCLRARLDAADHARARHEQLPPAGSERVQGRAQVGARGDGAREAPPQPQPARSRDLRRRRRRRAGVGSQLPPHARLLPRLPRRAHRPPALQLRLARRRCRQHLERAAGVLRHVGHEVRARDSRDLQPCDGEAVGRARAHRAQQVPPADEVRRA